MDGEGYHSDRICTNSQSRQRRTSQPPPRLAQGTVGIVVNSVLVRANGALTRELPGRVLSPERRDSVELHQFEFRILELRFITDAPDCTRPRSSSSLRHCV